MQVFSGRSAYENLDADPASKKNCTRLLPPPSLLIPVSVFVAVMVLLVITLSTTSNSKSSQMGDKFDLPLLQQAAEEGGEAPVQNDTEPLITVVVSITDGELQGKLLKSRDGRNYSAFYNIPYAIPPVGELRFEPPQKFTDGWTGNRVYNTTLSGTYAFQIFAGTRDATTPGDRCAQKKIGSDEVKGSEDCLYLSVFTPNLPRSRSRSSRRRSRQREENLPVMVYFFGGAFIGGYAQGYGADYFMDKDVVLVLPEYRVGTLGNLNTEDPATPSNIRGNMGFKDQVMVLRWVQENIARFSGNSSKVTIFGNSSGGMSVHAHLYSNMTRGLFHGAITQSGSALGLDVIDTEARERAEAIARSIGCLEEDLNVTSKLVSCLKQGNVTEILAAQTADLTGLTVEESPEDGGEVFLADTPLNLLQSERIVSDVPWIIGANSGEMGMMARILNDSRFATEIDRNWTAHAPDLLGLDLVSSEEIGQMVAEIRNFYFGSKNISLETGQEFGDMVSDRRWVHPTWVAASYYAQYASSPVYMYWLSYEEEGEEELSFGVGHAAEVKYFFPYSKFPYISQDSGNYNFSKTMVDIWAQFAGSEVGSGSFTVESGGDIDTEWIPFEKGNELWLRLDEGVEMMKDNPKLDERMRFWDGFEQKALYPEES